MPIKRKYKSLIKPKNKKIKNKNFNNDFEINSEIDSDDADSIPSENEESNEENNEEIENADDKRARLAKEYLSQVENDIKNNDSESDDNGVDDEINLKLKKDVLEATGKITHNYADILKDKELNYNYYRGHTKPVTSVAICADGSNGYSASKDCDIIKWDIETGKKIFKFKGVKRNKYLNFIPPQCNSDIILSIAVSPDNRYLASGGKDRIIRLYDCRSNEYIDSFKGHRGDINCLKFTGDGTTLYSGSDDRMIKSWNITDRSYIETLYYLFLF